MIRTACLALALGAGLLALPCVAAEYVATGARAFLRTEPGVSGDAVRRLETREPVRLLERRGRWVRVRTEDGRQGWVRSNRIRRPF